ncbi:MAG: hypothetical protein ACPGZP_02660 [Panacagrimonas sp.]
MTTRFVGNVAGGQGRWLQQAQKPSPGLRRGVWQALVADTVCEHAGIAPSPVRQLTDQRGGASA